MTLLDRELQRFWRCLAARDIVWFTSQPPFGNGALSRRGAAADAHAGICSDHLLAPI